MNPLRLAPARICIAVKRACKSEGGGVPCGISPPSIRTFRRSGFGYPSPASRCRRRPRPESLRPRSPCAFRHRSPVRAFPPSVEISGCPQISRNPGRPVPRGSSGRPALPEIRFRSLATPVARSHLRFVDPPATPVSRGCLRAVAGCSWTSVARCPRLPGSASLDFGCPSSLVPLGSVSASVSLGVRLPDPKPLDFRLPGTP